MTIREHFKLVNNRLRYFWAAVAVAVVFACQWLYPRANFLLVGVLLGAALIGPIILVARRVFRCPRCSASYQRMRKERALLLGADRRMYWDIWEACPECQLRFDEPWSKPYKVGK